MGTSAFAQSGKRGTIRVSNPSGDLITGRWRITGSVKSGANFKIPTSLAFAKDGKTCEIAGRDTTYGTYLRYEEVYLGIKDRYRNKKTQPGLLFQIVELTDKTLVLKTVSELGQGETTISYRRKES